MLPPSICNQMVVFSGYRCSLLSPWLYNAPSPDIFFLKSLIPDAFDFPQKKGALIPQYLLVALFSIVLHLYGIFFEKYCGIRTMQKVPLVLIGNSVRLLFLFTSTTSTFSSRIKLLYLQKSLY